MNKSKTRVKIHVFARWRCCGTKDGLPRGRVNLIYASGPERETLFVKTFSGSLTRRFNVAILNPRSLSGGERSSLSIFAVLGCSAAGGVVQAIYSQAVLCNLVIVPRREYLSTV